MLSDLVRFKGSKDSASIKGWDTGSAWYPVMKEILKSSPGIVGNKVPNEGKASKGFKATIIDKHGRNQRYNGYGLCFVVFICVKDHKSKEQKTQGISFSAHVIVRRPGSFYIFKNIFSCSLKQIQ